ncbi:MAG: hypothetical protein ACE5GN_00675, partial [Waddliaceae bacterium]
VVLYVKKNKQIELSLRFIPVSADKFKERGKYANHCYPLDNNPALPPQLASPHNLTCRPNVRTRDLQSYCAI